MNKKLLLLLLSIGIMDLFGQSPVSYQLEVEKGFVLLHSQDIAPIGEAYPTAVGLSVQKWLLAEKHWNSCHCYPRLGLSIAAHDFDNREVIGWGFPVYGFIEPWYKMSDRLYLSIRASAGLIYLTKPYDEIENPLNLSYSLPVQAFLVLGGGLAYELNDHWRIGLQARFDHTSNGGLREPNKGINYPTLSFSADYSLKPINLQALKKKEYNPLQKKKALRINGFLAGKAGAKVGEGAFEQEVTYLVSGLSIYYSHQFLRTSAFLVGTEWINNLAFKRQIERQGLNQDHNQLGFILGHEFLLGKFTFSQAAGFYLYKDYGAEANWYQRYSLLYRPIPGLAIGPGLKAHANVAEFVDFSLIWDIQL